MEGEVNVEASIEQTEFWLAGNCREDGLRRPRSVVVVLVFDSAGNVLVW